MIRSVLLCMLSFSLLPGSVRGEDKPDGTVEIKAGELKLRVPAKWESKPPSNNLRLAQFNVPAAEGDAAGAEVVVFPPFGGSVNANVQRWVGQFESDGRELKTLKGKTDQGEYVLVELKGTYKKPVGPPIQQKTEPTAGSKMVAVIFKSNAGGNYFLRLVGPEKTVEANAAPFRTAFGGDSAKEEKYELEAE
jgi:hypothetical protein